MKVGSTRFVTEMVKTIEERVTRKLGRSAYVNRYMGTVSELDTENNNVSVYVSGGTEASEGFKIRGSHSPVVGDRVVVCIDDQDRWVESVLHGVTPPKVRSYPTRGYVDFEEISTPTAYPLENQHRLYIKSDGIWYSVDEAGVELPVSPTAASKNVSLNFVIDGGGATISTGIKGDLWLDDTYTILGWTLLADQSGSIALDLWAEDYASYPPDNSDSLISDNTYQPKITSATKNASTTLTGWTTTLSGGTALRINVDSATSIQRVTLALHVQRTEA